MNLEELFSKLSAIPMREKRSVAENFFELEGHRKSGLLIFFGWRSSTVEQRFFRHKTWRTRQALWRGKPAGWNESIEGEANSMYHIYVLRSLKNQKNYIGMTSQNPNARLAEHLRGTAQWTRRNGPFQLIYQEEYTDKDFTRKREKYLKSGRGREFLKQKLKNCAGIAQG